MFIDKNGNLKMIPEFIKKTYDLLGNNKIIENALTTSYTEEDEANIFIKELQNEFKQNYKNAKKIKDLAEFHKQAIDIVINHFSKVGFYESKNLMKEIKYFMHYVFCVIQDDFFIGDRVFEKNMTKFDDYIFSKYRKNDKLSGNIRKLTSLAFSNRFDRRPKNNLLGYFVFIEENGIELISLLHDFYKMLEKTQKKSLFKFKFKDKYTKDKEEKIQSSDFNTVTVSVDDSMINRFNLNNFKKIGKE